MEKDCNNCKFELYNPDEIPCRDCGMDEREYWQPKPQTNADRIRAMTDEELAEAMCIHLECYACPVDECRGGKKICDCKERILKWLQQPAEET